LIKEFYLMGRKGGLLKVCVEYDWIPASCSVCRVLGHSSASCPKQGKQIATVDAAVTENDWIKLQDKGKGKAVRAENSGPGKVLKEGPPGKPVVSIENSWEEDQGFHARETPGSQRNQVCGPFHSDADPLLTECPGGSNLVSKSSEEVHSRAPVSPYWAC
jgi:hypothetical protein